MLRNRSDSALTQADESVKVTSQAPADSAKGTAILGLAALGIVFGDIGTSPLYVMRTVFTLGNGAVALTPNDIMGVTSAIIWVLLIIVTFKYVGFVLRADHDGVGGILALSTLVRSHLRESRRAYAVVALLGVFGASLFFGDSVITPAISVMSAVEGLSVAFPNMPTIVVPVALAILAALFFAQRFGTQRVGGVFGPIMLLWFTVLAVMGIAHIADAPHILLALSPFEAASFVIRHPGIAFVALGAIVLSVSGAEALYADVSHFGRHPIQLTWIAVVLPALALNYLGQGALLTVHPEAITNPFFHMVPEHVTVPLVLLATFATLIASQAVISGAYSTARQAIRLGYLPHLRVIHTSEKAPGQIYMPAVNGLLFAAVATVILVFQSSDRLSAAYGLAVSTDFVITTSLFVVLTHIGWKWQTWASVLFWMLLSSVEWPILAANVSKLFTGGWLPLSIACTLMFLMTTWKKGEAVVIRARKANETPLNDFLATLEKNPVRRTPGTVIYPHSMVTTTPISLKYNTTINHSMHDHIIIVSLKTVPVPHTSPKDRICFDKLDTTLSGITHITVKYGFMDQRDLSAALQDGENSLGLHSWKLETAWFLLSHLDIHDGGGREMSLLRKRIFIWMSRTGASPAWADLLPRERTLELSHRLGI